MTTRGRAAREVLFRFIRNNILILVLPMIVSLSYYAISIRSLQEAVDTTTQAQLARSREDIDRLVTEVEQMATTLANDYEVNSYLSESWPMSGIDYYNLKRISQRIAPYVFGNAVLGHTFIYMEKSDVLVFENGYGRFDDVYGSLFAAEGRTAADWRRLVLRPANRERFVLDERITLGGEDSVAHLYVRSIGYGDHYLGCVIATINRDSLGELLAEVPDRYGGLVYVQDEHGSILAESGDRVQEIPYATISAAEESVVIAGSDYRIYRATSSRHRWRYTALLNQTLLFEDVRAVRTIAWVLMGAGFLVGTLLAYGIATRSARPIGRVLELVLGPRDLASGSGAPSIYDQAEKAIVILSDSKRMLEDEVRSAQRIARVHFFQNALRGFYRTREAFDDDRLRCGIEFAGAPYYVIIYRLASLNAAREGSALATLRQSFLSASADAVGSEDFVVPVSLDDIAIVRACRHSDDPRTDATLLLARLRYGTIPVAPADYIVGIGRLTTDPYLLVVSCNQASAAVSSVATNGHQAVQFYDDLPHGTYSYFYAIDVEENVMRSVRSSNIELLESLLESIERENFCERGLSVEQLGDLFVQLQGTALRLINDVPEECAEITSTLAAWSDLPPSVDKLRDFHGILVAISDKYEQRKKSRNSALLSSVQEYIDANFADAGLSLTRIADVFGKSENYLSSFYKEQTGENLSVAIQRARFSVAEELLRRSDVSVDGVASRCGYGNSGSFRRAFKRVYGISPSEYRAQAAT